LPQTEAQSESWLAFAPLGQHPSPGAAFVIVLRSHFAVHCSVLPENVALMQPVDTQLLFVAQVVELFGSQVSCGAVTTPSPHRSSQSLSLATLAPSGQQPSPLLG
jgi:hypothetical protein